MKVTAHCVVKNEDKWVWFAINSVLPYVERMLVFDTGSTDRTVDIIKSIKSPKIIFEERGGVDRVGMVNLRREQIEGTKTDWFFILDGDEVWSEKNIEELFNDAQKNQNCVAVVNRVRNCIGDIFHYMSESAGEYEIAGIKGNLNIRLIRKTKTMTIKGEYPLERYQDGNGVIQEQEDNLVVSNAWCLHTSFLNRSSSKSLKVSGSFGRKRVWQRGISIPKEELPEVLFKGYPKLVDDPLKKRGVLFEGAALITSPLISAKRLVKR